MRQAECNWHFNDILRVVKYIAAASRLRRAYPKSIHIPRRSFRSGRHDTPRQLFSLIVPTPSPRHRGTTVAPPCLPCRPLRLHARPPDSLPRLSRRHRSHPARPPVAAELSACTCLSHLSPASTPPLICVGVTTVPRCSLFAHRLRATLIFQTCPRLYRPRTSRTAEIMS